MRVVEEYLGALGSRDLARLLGLFADGAVVHSPLYGTLPASDFYPRLFADTRDARLTLRAILRGAGAGAPAGGLGGDGAVGGRHGSATGGAGGDGVVGGGLGEGALKGSAGGPGGDGVLGGDSGSTADLIAFWFDFDWTLADGTPAPFSAVDIAELDGDGRIRSLHIVYDTFGVRSAFNALA